VCNQAIVLPTFAHGANYPNAFRAAIVNADAAVEWWLLAEDQRARSSSIGGVTTDDGRSLSE